MTETINTRRSPDVRAFCGVVQKTALVLSESRPVVQLVFAGRFVVGATMVGALPLSVPVGLAAWVSATIAVYLINGIADVDADRRNGSARPIATGRLSGREARCAAAACVALAVGLGTAVGWLTGVLVVAHLAVGIAYSLPPLRWKRTTTGAAGSVVAMGLLTYVAGAVAATGHPTAEVLVFGAAMACWMGGVGAVVKDFADVRGDAAGGNRTAVIRWGERRVRVLVCVVAAVIAGGLLLAAALAWPRLLLPAVTLCGGAVAVVLVTWPKAAGQSPPTGSRRPYRTFMVAQYLTNVAALVTY